MLLEFGGERVGLLARGRVDDGGAAVVIHAASSAMSAARCEGAISDHFDGEVVAAEAVDEARRLGRGRAGRRYRPARCGVAVAVRAMTGAGRSVGQVLAEHAVIGAEIVAPLGDAVGFVDGDEGGLALGEHLGEAGDAEALGGDEEELQFAVEVVDAGLAGGGAVAAGVDALDGEAACLAARRPGLP